MMIACTMLQSCDDFFDKTGDDSDVTAGKFFKDETAFMQALTGIYMQMRAPELYGNTLSLGMMEFASQTLEPMTKRPQRHLSSISMRQYCVSVWTPCGFALTASSNHAIE